MNVRAIRLLLLCFWVGAAFPVLSPGDELSEESTDSSDGKVFTARDDYDGEDLGSSYLRATPVFNLFQDQPPVELPLEQQPVTALPSPATEFLSLFSTDRTAILASVPAERQGQALGPSIDIVLGRGAAARVASDAGSIFRKSNLALGIATQRRSPIITDVLSRGRRNGQQAGSGSYWFPARQDLDTLLNKIDSRIVSDIIVVKGPYSALYGPGLAFYDVELLPAPRYDCCFESFASSSIDYQSNGEQFYGRQTVWGGSSNWGFRIGYGHRTGNDYEDGAGRPFPSSYKSRDIDVALGVDLSDYSHLDFHYLRLDQTDVEFPGQIFDFDFYVTDAYDLKFVTENNPNVDRLTVEGWYNRTRFAGNAQGAGTRRQAPFLNTLVFTGVTDVAAVSSGFRLAATWGEADCGQLTAGVDLRYMQQELNEIQSSVFNLFTPQNNPIPRSRQVNPGIYVDGTAPLGENLTVRSGARFDWVSSDAARFVEGADGFGGSPADGNPDDLEALLGAPFDQDFSLGLAYLTAEYRLNCHWSVLGGLGFSMRQPTMTELYAVTPFLAVFPQLVFTSPVGNPTLDPERLYQVDLGLKAEYSNMRAGINGFYSWINDYIAFDELPDFFGNPGVRFSYVNTDLATLAGGEAYIDYDVNCYVTSFATFSYVEGRDRSRNDSVSLLRQNTLPGTTRSAATGVVNTEREPLPVIAPLDARVGLRLHQPVENPAWSVEVSARIVDNQDRIATSLQERLTPGFTMVDLRAYWQCRENLLLTFGVENLGNRSYQEHFDAHGFFGADLQPVFQPGTSFYFGTESTY